MSERVKPMSELHNEPTIDWLIKDWVAGNEFSVFWGDSGVYKSFVVQGLSLQLARKGNRVVYVAAEGSTGLAARVHAWNALNLGNPIRSTPTWFYSPVPIDFGGHENIWMEWSDEISDELDADPDLVVLDTLARCNLSGDENSTKDMGKFVDNIERFRRDSNCAVWVVHHANVAEKKRERGSTVLRAAAFGMYKISNPRRKASGASVEIECDKMKDGAAPDPVRVDLYEQGLDVDEHGDIYRSSLAIKRFPQDARPVEPESNQDPKDMSIVKIVERHGAITGKQLAPLIGVDLKAANQMLHRQAQLGLLVKDQMTGLYMEPDDE